MEIFCFLLGILYAYTLNFYLLIAPLLIFYITPRYPIILMFVSGLLFALLHQWLILPKGMPDVSVISHAVLEGTIVSIPVVNRDKTQFTFLIKKINGLPAYSLAQISWYNHAPKLGVGQDWQLTAKLKKPRNFNNPGSYNYENALRTRHIYWTGYIQPTNNVRTTKQFSNFSWLRLREHLSKKLTQMAPNAQASGVIEALTLNITNHISQEDWSLFRRTGTTHLFGISGEHIALLSGLFFWITRWLWSRSVLCCLYVPAPAAASVGGLSIALLYAFLAGFAPPVQRALIGCGLYTLCCLGKQRFTPWQAWRYALFGVLCIEPHAVFMQGFYFSFLAVACLLITQQRWQITGYKGALALQLSCLIGLMPLTLYWFSYASINGFIANLFAIPLVGFLIVPLALITMCVSCFSWSWVLMKPLSWLIAVLFQGLVWIERLSFININWFLGSIEYVLCFMGTLLIWTILPVKPLKYLAIIWLIIPFFPPRSAIKTGEMLVQVLDVGQGLSVTIQTKNHVLLYDTGDQFFRGSDLGTMVILPFYQTSGIKKIDKIIISHPDKDHLGGLKSVESNLPVGELLVNDPHYYRRGLNCHSYPQWRWDEVDFRFLPITAIFDDKNNNSCILQVSNSTGTLLLTGDIEKNAEDYLVRTYGSQLKSDILIVPHHGSKTSSSYRFLLEIAPRYAIASLGFDNRFHFPHAKTLATMTALKIPLLRTDECGMTKILIPKQGAIQRPQCSRRV